MKVIGSCNTRVPSASAIATAPGIADELATVIQTAGTHGVLHASSAH